MMGLLDCLGFMADVDPIWDHEKIIRKRYKFKDILK